MNRADPAFGTALYEIGHLTYVWTNTESLLVHILAGLLGCDKDRALLVYLTLSTTRARLDLVERLAKSISAPPARTQILDCTKRLAKLAGERNFYNHALYAFDPENGAISTIQMRISDRGAEMKIGKRHPLDRAAIRDLQQVISDLTKLNHEIWQLIRQQGFPL